MYWLLDLRCVLRTNISIPATDDMIKCYVLREKLKLFSININLKIFHKVLLAENTISVSS